MLKNYFKIAWRNLLRKKMYAFINIFGLSVAIACCIVAYLNYDYSYGFDAFHKNADNIFRVESIRLINGQEQRWGIAPLPLGPALAQDFSAVVRAVRFANANAVLRYQDKVFNENLHYADPGFFEMFTFPLKHGSAEVLSDKTKLVLSEEYAHKYFGDENPLGKQITVRYPGGQKLDFIVGAVIRKTPKNSSLDFDVLASGEILVDVGIDEPHNWAHWNTATFVQVQNPAGIAAVHAQMQKYVQAQNSANPQLPVAGFYFEPLREIALRARDLRANDLPNGVPPSAIAGPSIIGALLLLMACCNYMNTSIAFSANRLKEIGVRKVVGSLRSQLVGQFLGENLLLCAISLILALGWTEVLVPGYNRIITEVELVLNYSQNIGLLLFLAALLLATALGAGAYPAFYVSRYNPVNIIKGRQTVLGMNKLMRVLLGVQFALSMIAVAGSVVFAQNADYQNSLDLGFEKSLLAVMPIANESEYELLRHAIVSHPSVLSVSGSRNHIFFSWARRQVKNEEREAEVQVLGVGVDYLKTTGIRLGSGRDFDRDLPTDASDAILINQKMATEFGWYDPIGKQVALDSARLSVIGVVEDFHNDGMWRPIQPVMLRLVKPEAYRFLQARVHPENLAATVVFLRETWRRLIPETPYAGFFQDEIMAESTMVNQEVKTIFFYVALIAVVISAMGLFALVSLNIAKRTKEIGIRKVLGASVGHIIHLINREFLILLMIALVGAYAAGYFAIEALLGSIYAYHIHPTVMAFVMAGALIFFVAIFTVGSQVYRVATTNPVNALRYE